MLEFIHRRKVIMALDVRRGFVDQPERVLRLGGFWTAKEGIFGMTAFWSLSAMHRNWNEESMWREWKEPGFSGGHVHICCGRLSKHS